MLRTLRSLGVSAVVALAVSAACTIKDPNQGAGGAAAGGGAGTASGGGGHSGSSTAHAGSAGKT
ncbi:MAG TPA: hypothetical protein VNG33_03005, partial [Polyangiaceae bacterium]|nr:hypothetical protein [Polyangiaceae bacterium]